MEAVLKVWEKWEFQPTSDSSINRSSGTLKAPCKLIRAVLMPIAVKRSVPTLHIFSMSETQSMTLDENLYEYNFTQPCSWVMSVDISPGAWL